MALEIDCDWPLWPKQEECFESPANDQLFGGASEGGKSYLGRVGISSAGMECEGLTMTLIRKKFSDIATNHLDGDKGFRKLLYPLTSKGIVDITEKRIRFPKDNICNFKHCQDERQFDSAQGNENQIVVVDEAPQIQERLIRAFRGWCRITPEHLARQPEFWQTKLPWFLQTGNPLGASVGYYRKEYVNARKPGTIEEFGGFRRQYIPSKAQDNKSVNLLAHAARLAQIGDPELARALDLGDWDALVGDYIRQWDAEKHVVDDIGIPPAHLFKFRAFDWGGGSPFAVGWFFVSDGEEFQDSYGKTRWFPRGALVCYREWYGCEPGRTAIGIDLPNDQMAKGIVQRTEEISSGITVTDSLPFQKRGGELMAETFARNGCPLTRGNTDRIVGWKQMKDMLTGRDGMPLLYFTRSCRFAADYIPALQRHKTNPEDAEEHGEATHMCDMIRLACMTRPPITSLPKIIVPKVISSPKMSATPNALLKQLNRKQKRTGRY